MKFELSHESHHINNAETFYKTIAKQLGLGPSSCKYANVGTPFGHHTTNNS